VSLEDSLKKGVLTTHSPSRDEISALLGVVARDLRDCRVPGLSPEWRLSIAYNAILQAAAAALAASGYRVRRREGHHYYTLQSLAHTVGVETKLLHVLDVLRTKRHLSDYVRSGAVSAGEADEAVALADQLCAQVHQWLAQHHPHLLAAGDA